MAHFLDVQLLHDYLQVRLDHLRNQLRKRRLMLPAQHALRLARIAPQKIDFNRKKITRIDLDQRLARSCVQSHCVDARALPLDLAPYFRERQLIDSSGIERRRTPLDSMHNVAFAKQQFHQVCAILACDIWDKNRFSHSFPRIRWNMQLFYSGYLPCIAATALSLPVAYLGITSARLCRFIRIPESFSARK
jgi:hypothetical protein